MPDNALLQARTMLNELTEAARKGQIIPIRLTGQLEAIEQMLDKADEEQNAARNSGGSGDLEVYRKELAGLLSHGFHDLRLPLTNIRGYADMLATPGMGDLNDMQQQFVGTIRSNSRRLETLLTDISDLSKLRGGTLKVTPKMDMFKNIAMMVEKNMRPVAEELGRRLEFELPQGLPLLNIDGEMLTKALDKLVENGLRYSPPETGLVKISARGEGNQLHITIQDNGIGIKPEEIVKLGTAFFRGDNELILSYKGSGLGIPIAYGIIELLGGQISLVSQPDQGTIFTVILAGMS
jgi:signal transduction histidine kinase